MKVFNGLICILAVSLSASVFASGETRKSSSGLCHEPASPYYDRIKTFEVFPTFDSCINSGGRAPKHRAEQTVTPTDQDYARARFGHGWADEDQDCLNSRMEALIAQSTTPVRFAEGNRCRVVSGRWISPFTGKVLTDARTIDVDHVVSLKFAWDRGARAWPQHLREKFANDPVNLLSVEASLNRQKGAQGPDKWLPPSSECQYLARFLRVVKIYGLQPRPSESQAYQRLLTDRCNYPGTKTTLIQLKRNSDGTSLRH